MRLITSVLLVLCVWLPACSTEPTIGDVAGSYAALKFETTADDVVRNELSFGASISMRLEEDNTTTGRLFVPGAAEDGGDLDVDLSGTWSLDSTFVTFDHAADTFLRDMMFLVSRDTTTQRFYDSDDQLISADRGPNSGIVVAWMSDVQLSGEAVLSRVRTSVILGKQ